MVWVFRVDRFIFFISARVRVRIFFSSFKELFWAIIVLLIGVGLGAQKGGQIRVAFAQASEARARQKQVEAERRHQTNGVATDERRFW